MAKKKTRLDRLKGLRKRMDLPGRFEDAPPAGAFYRCQLGTAVPETVRVITVTRHSIPQRRRLYVWAPPGVTVNGRRLGHRIAVCPEEDRQHLVGADGSPCFVPPGMTKDDIL